jgi:hypothetical protein
MITPSTITGRVAELHANVAAGSSSEVMGAFSREQAALAVVEPADIAKIGTVLADTELLDANAAATTLYAATGPATSVPGSPVPVLQHGLVHLPGTPPPATDRQRHQACRGQPADAGRIADHAAEARPRLPSALWPRLQLGLDLTSVNADATIGLPMPATVILDDRHTVRWIDVHPDYSTRTEPRQILDALAHLGY